MSNVQYLKPRDEDPFSLSISGASTVESATGGTQGAINLDAAPSATNRARDESPNGNAEQSRTLHSDQRPELLMSESSARKKHPGNHADICEQLEHFNRALQALERVLGSAEQVLIKVGVLAALIGFLWLYLKKH